MRASDQLKAVRSYVVENHRTKGLHVAESHWAVGYTPAHKATPLEALDYAIEEAEQKMMEAQARVVELHDLRATMVDQLQEDIKKIAPEAEAWPNVIKNWPIRGDE